jgi:hypothetical protein
MDPIKQLEDQAKKYVEDMRSAARGDYDFQIKWLTTEMEKAMGSGDKQRADFLVKVADTLEQQVGRIPYDYMQKTDREKQDISLILKKNNMDQDNILAQQKQFEKQQAFAKAQEQKQIRESANARGMLDSGIEKNQQDVVAQNRQLNVIDPQQMATDQALKGLAFNRDVSQLTSTRNLQDLTTQARRGAIDQTQSFQLGQEKSSRSLEQRLADIRAQEYIMDKQVDVERRLQKERDAELQASLNYTA